MRLAIVVRQRIVDRLDAVLVFLAVDDVVRAADGMGRHHAQFLLQRGHKGLNQVHVHAAGLADHGRQVVLHQGGENDRALAVAGERFVDLARRLVGLVHGIDEGQADLAEAQIELREHRVAERLGGDAGAVGNEENGAGRGGQRRAWILCHGFSDQDCASSICAAQGKMAVTV
ncbi:hypothetical protein D3C72_1773700 [compost metagenome]